MTVGEALAKINEAFRGSDDDAPTFGDEEATIWLSVMNTKKDEFYRDTRQKWSSAFSNNALATTVSAGDQDYDLGATLLQLSDQVYVLDTNSVKHYYDVIKPQERTDEVQEVYLSGVNPQVLNFTKTIAATDDIVGGTIYAPGYYLPADLTASSDDIPIPDPYWLVYATAAELAFNDVVYETKAADLTNRANQMYKQMVIDNRAGTYENPRRVAYRNRNRITSPTRR